MHSLRPLGSRDRGFESHSGHGCLVFVNVYVFFYVCVQVEALRRANHPSKESYRPSLIKKLIKIRPIEKKKLWSINKSGRLSRMENRYKDFQNTLQMIRITCKTMRDPCSDQHLLHHLGSNFTPLPVSFTGPQHNVAPVRRDTTAMTWQIRK
jgi:hypothetical protein